MPVNSSLLVKRRMNGFNRSPKTPNQLARIAKVVVGWAMIAGVQSMVWILAISATLIRRALS